MKSITSSTVGSIDYGARLPTSVSAATAPRGSSALTATSTDGLTTIGSACPEPALPSALIDRDRLGSSTQQTKSIGGPGAHSNAYPGWRATSGLKTRSGSSAQTARFTVSTLASGLPPGAWPCVSALARTGRPGWWVRLVKSTSGGTGRCRDFPAALSTSGLMPKVKCGWSAHRVGSLFEERFRQRRVNPLGGIDRLRDVQIRRQRAQHVGILARHLSRHEQEINHLANGQPRGFVQVFVQSHGNVVRRRFSPRPAQSLPFSKMQFERAAQRGLERRAGHLAIALPRVAIPDRQQRAGNMHRQVQDRTRDEGLDIQLAALPAARPAG